MLQKVGRYLSQKNETSYKDGISNTVKVSISVQPYTSKRKVMIKA